ncbi:MAG: hypothetical protein E6Q97_07730 [Desulfurellales bacterium]|nr:MAG: hypothetical protein E6Q97_07730 [Desulfurellales bacterium]
MNPKTEKQIAKFIELAKATESTADDGVWCDSVMVKRDDVEVMLMTRGATLKISLRSIIQKRGPKRKKKAVRK